MSNLFRRESIFSTVNIFTVSSHAQSVPGGGGLVEDADVDEEEELQAGTEQKSKVFDTRLV